MEASERMESCMSREQQMKIIGMLAELRDRVDKENLRSRISYRTRAEGLSSEHICKWSDDMIEKLEEMQRIVKR